MVDRIVRCFILAVVASVSLSCAYHPFGRFAPPRLVQGSKPDPVEDYTRLRELFRKNGGDLVTAEDQTVTWKDTSMFRMFEFKHHTVVIFPYNWTPERYNVIIVAGHINPEVNPFDALNYKTEYQPTTRRWIEGVNWDLDEAVRRVSFLGFQLSQPQGEVIDSQTRYILRTNPDQNDIDCLTGFGELSLGKRDDVHFEILYEGGKVAHMSFNPAKPRRAVTLGEYALASPVTPVEAQGQFPIPARNP